MTPDSMLTAPSTAPVDVLEALLFASDAPIEAERIREVLGLADIGEVLALVEELRVRFETAGRALQITEVAGGYRMVTRAEVAPWLIRLARSRTRARLSRPALETLAIVGYRQPVSRPEIDAIRGVNSEGVLDSLLERRLIRIAGRKEAPGRPFLYETTREFLVAFGLRDRAELPKVEGELLVPDVTAGAAAADADAATETDASEDGTPASEVVAGEIAAAEEEVDAVRGEDGAAHAEDGAAHAEDAVVERESSGVCDEGALAVSEEGGAAEETDATADERLASAEDAPATAQDTVASADNSMASGEERTEPATPPGRDGEDQAQQAPGPGGAHVETGR